MSSVPSFWTRFIRHAGLALTAISLMGLLVSLGLWQFARAREKEQILASRAGALQQRPETWNPGDSPPEQFAPFRTRGHFLEQQFLLDNQFHHHQAGYRVLSPFRVQGGGILLVDRGWVPGGASRLVLPDAPVPAGERTVTGTGWYPSAKQWVLGVASENDKAGKLTVIEREDTRLVTELLHKSVYPFIMRLDPDEPDGFVREWSLVSMSPDRHRAYAWQWFALALVVPCVYAGLLRKSKT